MALDLQIVPEPHSDMDRLAVINEANATSYIAMLTVADLKHFEHAQAIFYYYDGEAVVGFGAWQRVSGQWDEIGPFFNRDAYRGQGLGRRMFHDVVSHLEAQDRSLYAVTKNDAVKHMLEGYGFVETAMLRLPALLLLHLVSRLHPKRLYYGLRKMSSAEPTIHLVKPFPYAKGK
ncbi:MAG TPA: GNAT family N-acetyltransferase, partial [Candidatus Limnocylindrales bacterium]|nr:GNAT family N-acetyltransferase [Candidatus Limnocylindrales bacterium]